MRRALLLVASVIGLVILPAAPAASQVPTVGQETGTWVGQVVPHGSHFDYVGLPCPVEAEVCIQIEVRYLLVPTTRQAYVALAEASGGDAALTGRLLTIPIGEHQGILFVSSVD